MRHPRDENPLDLAGVSPQVRIQLSSCRIQLAAMNATLVVLGLTWVACMTRWSVLAAWYGDYFVHRPWYAQWRIDHSLISIFFVVGIAVPLVLGRRSERFRSKQLRWRAQMVAVLPALLAASMLLLSWIVRFGGIASYVARGSRCYGIGYVPPYLMWDPLWILYLTVPVAGASLVAALGLRSALRLPSTDPLADHSEGRGRGLGRRRAADPERPR